jgi:hypothetical protein
MHRIFRASTAGLAALALVAAACGNDDTVDETTEPDQEERSPLADAVRATLDEGRASFTIVLAEETAGTTGTDDTTTTTTGGTDDTTTTTVGTDGAGTTGTTGTGTEVEVEVEVEVEGVVSFDDDRRALLLDGAAATTGTGTEDTTTTTTAGTTDDDAATGTDDDGTTGQAVPTDRIVIEGSDIYVPWDADGAEWGRADLSDLDDVTTVDRETLVALHDPAAVLRAIESRADGDATDDGTAAGGRHTVTLRAGDVDDVDDVVQTEALFEDLGLDELVVRVELSGDVVSSMTYELDAGTTATGTATEGATVTVELTDLGTAEDVEVPDVDDVVEVELADALTVVDDLTAGTMTGTGTGTGTGTTGTDDDDDAVTGDDDEIDPDDDVTVEDDDDTTTTTTTG